MLDRGGGTSSFHFFCSNACLGCGMTGRESRTGCIFNEDKGGLATGGSVQFRTSTPAAQGGPGL